MRHQMRVACDTDVVIFTVVPGHLITEYSSCIPRVINTLCDHCLISGYADSKRRIDVRMVEDAIEYLEDGKRPRWKRRAQARLTPSPQWVWAARGGVAALVVALLAIMIFAVNNVGWLP